MTNAIEAGLWPLSTWAIKLLEHGTRSANCRRVRPRSSRARAIPGGVWGDVTTSGATIATLTDITDQLVILPKLFHRLAEYFALSAGEISLAGFGAFLAGHTDRLFAISEGHSAGFDNVIDGQGQTERPARDRRLAPPAILRPGRVPRLLRRPQQTVPALLIRRRRRRKQKNKIPQNGSCSAVPNLDLLLAMIFYG